MKNFRPGNLICCPTIDNTGCQIQKNKRTGNYNNPNISQVNIAVNAIRYSKIKQSAVPASNRLVLFGRAEGQPGGILGKPTNF